MTRKHLPLFCHPREGGDPVYNVDIDANAKLFNWAPAFAGMTVAEVSVCVYSTPLSDDCLVYKL